MTILGHEILYHLDEQSASRFGVHPLPSTDREVIARFVSDLSQGCHVTALRIQIFGTFEDFMKLN